MKPVCTSVSEGAAWQQSFPKEVRAPRGPLPHTCFWIYILPLLHSHLSRGHRRHVPHCDHGRLLRAVEHAVVLQQNLIGKGAVDHAARVRRAQVHVILLLQDRDEHLSRGGGVAQLVRYLQAGRAAADDDDPPGA